MAKTTELKSIDDFQTMESTFKMMGYDPTSQKYGWIPASFVTGDGYACRRWNKSNATPIGEAVGNLDYLRNLPTLLGLGAYLVDNNHGRRKLSPTNHYKFATGDTAALDGSMGHYQWGWATKWYIAFWTEGNYFYEAVKAGSPIKGRWNYEIPIASMSATGCGIMDNTNMKLVSYINNGAQYRGGNNDSAKDAAFNTLLGRAATCHTPAEWQTYAAKNGSGWYGALGRFIAAYSVLIDVIFGTWNHQTAYNASKDSNNLYQGGLGRGVCDFGKWDTFGYFPFIPTSSGIELADACGYVNVTVTYSDGTTTTVPVPSFFGLKHPFGYIFKQTVDETAQKLSDGSTQHYMLTSLLSGAGVLDDLTKFTKGSIAPSVNSTFITDVEMGHLENFPIACNGGSESTYFCDFMWANASDTSGLRSVARGGDAYYGGFDGSRAVIVYNGVGLSFASYGSPLCEVIGDWLVEPVYYN
jgi:hypothetical protein